MANFKTVMRLAKLPWYKLSFVADGMRIVNADNSVMVWGPAVLGEQDGTVYHDAGAYDIDGEQVDLPLQVNVEEHGFLISLLSPRLEDMVKVNSNFLRRAMSALETGNNPIYIEIQERRICLAYEADGVVHRAAIATMENRHGTDNAGG